MSTKFQPIEIPPGVVTHPTKNVRSSNWAEANLVRWTEGELQPVGGQSQYAYTFASRCKAIHGWYDLQGVYHVAYVCEQNVYVDTAGTLTEITPTGGWAAPPLPTQGGYGDLLYGEDNYGTPRTSGSSNPIDVMPNVWSVDNFGALLLVMYSVDGRLLQWDPGATANANDVQTLSLIGGPAGGNFTLIFGNQTTGPIAYNATAANVQSALVALSNVGSGNVVCAGGPLPAAVTVTFQGSLANAPQPTLVIGANNLTGGTGPTTNIVHTTNGTNLLLTRVGGSPHGRLFQVTQERFVMMFGQNRDGTTDGGSARRFGWCDQENLTAWNFQNVTSQAGFLDIEPASPIVTAIAGRFGVLFFTAQKAYVSRYGGLPYVYNYVELADECTPWSPASITTTSSYILWMAEQGMFSFDGMTIMPVACLVRPWVVNDVDPVNVREQACAVHISQFSEFWWFFPQNGKPYNTRAIIYNFREGWWSQAQMARSAGITSSYTVQSILANGTIAYQHELGSIYSADAAAPFAETFDLNLTSGVRLATLKQVMPDVDGDAGNLQFSFWAQNSRSLVSATPGPGQGNATPGQWTPPIPVRPDGYVDARITGRDIRMRISTISPQILPFTLGQHQVDIAVRGDR
jgi:hypothetical protein